MKRVTIPIGKEKENLVFNSLKTMHNMLDNLGLDKNDEVHYALFDLIGLMGIFSGDYKVTIEISQDDMDSFASKHGVDFPAFVNLEVVEIHDKGDYPQYFQHLAYLEDGALSFAVRSNKPFPDADDEGADPQEVDSPRFHLYKEAQPGEAIFFEGTSFFAAPIAKRGWAIIENGKVIEKVMIK